jgi:hypothetical protein
MRWRVIDPNAWFRQRPVQAVALVGFAVAIGILALGAWLALPGSDDPRVRDAADLARALAEVRAAIEPIARDYSSRPTTAPIDVGSFRERIETARAVVVAVNDIPVESREGLEVRDAILGGGAAVLDGLDAALDALLTDDAAAAELAGQQVGEGTDLLQQAEDALAASPGD